MAQAEVAREVFSWVQLFLPLVLSRVKATQNMAMPVSDAVNAVEQVLGPGTGQEKLARVVKVAQATGDAINAVRPGSVDTTVLGSAVESGVNTAFKIAQIVADAHGAPADDPTSTTGVAQ